MVEIRGIEFQANDDNDMGLEFVNLSHRFGSVAQIALWDSLCESSMVAGGHEQMGPHEVQDHELVGLQ